MRTETAILAMTAWLATGGAVQAADLCATMKAIIDNQHDFAPLRGDQLTDRAWRSTAEIDGFESCEISTFKDGLILTCDGGTFEQDEQKPAYQKHDTIVDAMWACPVFDTLSLRETRREGYESRSTFLSAGDASLNIEASQTFSSAGGTLRDVWAVRLTMFEE